MVYLLRALLNGVIEVHRQPETVHREIVQRGGHQDYGFGYLSGDVSVLPGGFRILLSGVGVPPGSSGILLGGVGNLAGDVDILPDDGYHLLFVVLSINKSLHVM